MKPFYTILYAVTNNLSDEKIAVALIFVEESVDVLFSKSNEKLDVVKGLLSKNGFDGIKFNIDQIERASKEEKLIFTFEYFDYLNKYNNNLLVFSKPKTIDIEHNTENFKKLCKKFINVSKK